MPYGYGPPPGGPHGPHGFHGRGPLRGGFGFFRPPRYPRFADLAGKGSSSGGAFAPIFNLDASVNTIFTECVLRKGAIKGAILSARMLTSGAFREETYLAEVETYEEEFEENKITASAYKKRCLEAATKYYDYLKKIGYCGEKEYFLRMEKVLNAVEEKIQEEQAKKGRSK